jgi:hypothetical protein
VVVDAESGEILSRIDRLRYAQGRIYDVSPYETLAAECPISGGNHTACATTTLVELQRLTSATTLTGPALSARNCKGGSNPTPGACTQTAAVGGNFDFQPAANATDAFAEVMVYHHLDKHNRLLQTLDPVEMAAVPALNAYVNAYDGGAPLDNAFYSPTVGMVFGQGTTKDFSHFAEIAYHEYTHAVIDKIAGWVFAVETPNGDVTDPAALHEGVADALAQGHVNDAQLAEGIIDGEPYLRTMEHLRVCDGSITAPRVTPEGLKIVTGYFGEVHADGELWGGYFWELYQGLKGFDASAACGGAPCNAANRLMMYAVARSTTTPTMYTLAQSMLTGAQELFPSKPEVATFVQCINNRRRMERCANREVPVFLGESKGVDLGQIGTLSNYQVSFQTTGPATISACVVGGTGQFAAGFRNGAQANINVPPDATLQITAPCGGPQSTVNLPSAGKWYALFETNGQGTILITATSGVAVRPPLDPLLTCTLGGGPGDPGGEGGGGGGGGTGGGSSGGNSSSGGGCATAPAGLASLLALIALRRRQRR